MSLELRRPGRWRGTVTLALFLPVATAGCGGLRLYDADRDKVAQGAKKSFERADTGATITVARQNLEALTAAEVAQARRVVELRRDLLLRAIAGDASCDPKAGHPAAPRFFDTYVACIDRELGLAVGPVADPARLELDLLRATADARSSRDALADDRTKFMLLFNGVALPPCDPLEPPPATVPAELAAAVAKAAPGAVGQLPAVYGAFVRDCTGSQRASSRIRTAGVEASDLGRAAAAWTKAQRDLSEARAIAAKRKQEYDTAVAAYRAAAEKVSTERSDAAQQAAAEALKQAQAAAKAVGDAGGMIGVKLLSEDRLKQIDAVLTALKADTVAPEALDENARQALAGVATLPAFADQAIDIARHAAAPRLGSLILVKELELARATAADRQVSRAEQRIALLEQGMAGHLTRTMALLEARRRIVTAPRSPAVFQGSAVDAFGGGTPPPARAELLRSITAFADSFSIGGATAAEAEYRVIALEYDVVMDRSEDAANEWLRVIGVPIDRLVAFHGSGIRPENLAAVIVQFLGLGAIGAGVNR